MSRHMKINQRPAGATIFTRTRVSLLILEVRTILRHREQDVIIIRSQKKHVQNLIISGYSQDDVYCQCSANLDTALEVCHGRGCLQVTLTLDSFQLDCDAVSTGRFFHFKKRFHLTPPMQWGRRPNPQHTKAYTRMPMQ